ncbi:MAG: GNAT family N-acetyltransferase [Polyangiaceae bacterium]
MAVVIREHKPGGDLKDFIAAGHAAFKGDASWVPPLDADLKERMNPKKNPFFGRGEATLFTAWRDGKVVGRCSASIDHEHLRVWKDDTGFFGFFDTVDDEDVARALLDAAENWLRKRGMKNMRGPFSLYANEEVGILVEGFEFPPVIAMAHSRSYQGALCEKLGLTKEKDLWCWRFERGEIPKRAVKAWEETKKLPEVRLRSIDMKHMKRDIDAIIDIYNDAWDGKWGFVPVTRPEATKIAQDFKLIIDKDIAFLAEVDGKIAGMCIMLPNINEAIKDLNGKLFPTGLLKLLYRMKVKHPESTRLMMLGLKREIRQNMKRYGGLSAAMYCEVAKRGLGKGYNWSELSWTREDDAPINLGIKAMGAKVYKKYRVYQKPL